MQLEVLQGSNSMCVCNSQFFPFSVGFTVLFSCYFFSQCSLVSLFLPFKLGFNFLSVVDCWNFLWLNFSNLEIWLNLCFTLASHSGFRFSGQFFPSPAKIAFLNRFNCPHLFFVPLLFTQAGLVWSVVTVSLHIQIWHTEWQNPLGNYIPSETKIRTVLLVILFHGRACSLTADT